MNFNITITAYTLLYGHLPYVQRYVNGLCILRGEENVEYSQWGYLLSY